MVEISFPFFSVSETSKGLVVGSVCNSQLQTVDISFFVRTGSRFENKDNNGISHFLEHMVFRGSKQYSAPYEITSAIEQFGGYIDASTYRDFTLYNVQTHHAHVAECLEVLAGMLVAPRFLSIETERMIILEEMKESLNEKGNLIDIDALSYKNLFPSHPLGFPIDGSLRNIKKFTPNDFINYHRDYYTNQNSILLVSGNVHPRNIVSLAEEYFDEYHLGKKSVDKKPELLKKNSIHFVEAQDSQVQMRLAFPTYYQSEKDLLSFLFVSRLLDDGMSGILRRTLVDDLGLAYDLSCHPEIYSDVMLIIFEMTVSQEKCTKTLKGLLKILTAFCGNGAQITDFNRVKKRMIFHLDFMLDSVRETNFWLGNHLLFEQNVHFEAKKNIIRLFENDTVIQSAQKIFSSPCSLVAIGNIPRNESRHLRRLIAERNFIK